MVPLPSGSCSKSRTGEIEALLRDQPLVLRCNRNCICWGPGILHNSALLTLTLMVSYCQARAVNVEIKENRYTGEAGGPSALAAPRAAKPSNGSPVRRIAPRARHRPRYALNRPNRRAIFGLPDAGSGMRCPESTASAPISNHRPINRRSAVSAGIVPTDSDVGNFRRFSVVSPRPITDTRRVLSVHVND